ncbi:MAG: PAS domain-containing protein [Acidobacteriota bacterium]
MERAEIEHRIEKLSRDLAELRVEHRSEARLCSLRLRDRIDFLGHYLDIDPRIEEIFGFPQSEYWEDEHWIHDTHREDQGRIYLLWERTVAGRTWPLVEYRDYNVAGEWVWIEDSFRPAVVDSAGRVLVVEGCWRDITPRKRREIEFLLRQWETILKSRRLAGGELLPFTAGLARGNGRGQGLMKRSIWSANGTRADRN